MSSRNIYRKLGNRFSVEMQLLAEEKWLMEALAKIKKQRNSLQIERLQLESLKADLKNPTNPSIENKQIATDIATTSKVNTAQKPNTKIDAQLCEVGILPSKEPEIEVQCNSEELDLLVTDPIYAGTSRQHAVVEEEEEEESEEEEEDNVLIDINMLMNAVEDN